MYCSTCTHRVENRYIHKIDYIFDTLWDILNHSVEGPSKITKLSEKWAGLMESEKGEWKEKASKGIFSTVSTPEQKKRAVRELISITQENVS